MSDIRQLTEKVLHFRNARDWAQFHKPKDVAISLMLEAAEVAEHFQWKNEQETGDYCKLHGPEIGDELADVLYWVLLMSHDLGIDLEDAFERKMQKNAAKYPPHLSRGSAAKYTRLAVEKTVELTDK